MRRLPIAALVASALAVPLVAQVPPAFEVASIRANTSGSPRSGTQNLPGGRVTVTNQPLRSMIRTAYGANDLEVVGGGPDWIDRDRWDVLAAAAPDSPADAPWQEMLKTLLVERFELRAHFESRERPIYRLVFARGDKVSDYAERRVFDATGDDRRYDFDLKWGEDLSVFTALSEQLGLKLEAASGPLDVLFIDSVEKPAPE